MEKIEIGEVSVRVDCQLINFLFLLCSVNSFLETLNLFESKLKSFTCNVVVLF